MKHRNNRAKGFTILELMIAVTVAGILAAVALPSFGDLLKNNRLTTQANTIMASLNFARSETVNRGTDVLVEPIVAGTDWSGGWKVSNAGTTIRNFDATDGGTLISSAASITYEPDGKISGTATITLTLSAEECTTGKEFVRTLTIAPSGHARVSKDICP